MQNTTVFSMIPAVDRDIMAAEPISSELSWAKEH